MDMLAELLEDWGKRKNWRQNISSGRTGIVIELKYAENGDMAAACQKALNQIEEKKYTARLKEDGMRSIIQYGIACYKKDCEVKMH